ncbi:hypothetical protein [Falsiroseomonas sp. E2-1-a4]|uniref:hypothetical protein n=1 Tax=Falsiroseomonas sp. E2-1-a4 TaxID=3239299 RepID=UPI003F2DF0E5
MQILGDLGWKVLQEDPAPSAPVQTDLVLAHPAYGVALLDLEPRPAAAAPVQRLRARLRAIGFRRFCPGGLPVIHLTLSERDMWRLLLTLDHAFAKEPAIAQTGDRQGLRWMGQVRQALLPESAALQPDAVEEPPAQATAQPADAPPADVAAEIVALLSGADEHVAPPPPPPPQRARSYRLLVPISGLSLLALGVAGAWLYAPPTTPLPTAAGMALASQPSAAAPAIGFQAEAPPRDEPRLALTAESQAAAGSGASTPGDLVFRQAHTVGETQPDASPTADGAEVAAAAAPLPVPWIGFSEAAVTAAAEEVLDPPLLIVPTAASPRPADPAPSGADTPDQAAQVAEAATPPLFAEQAAEEVAAAPMPLVLSPTPSGSAATDADAVMQAGLAAEPAPTMAAEAVAPPPSPPMAEPEVTPPSVNPVAAEGDVAPAPPSTGAESPTVALPAAPDTIETLAGPAESSPAAGAEAVEPSPLADMPLAEMPVTEHAEAVAPPTPSSGPAPALPEDVAASPPAAPVVADIPDEAVPFAPELAGLAPPSVAAPESPGPQSAAPLAAEPPAPAPPAEAAPPQPTALVPEPVPPAPVAAPREEPPFPPKAGKPGTPWPAAQAKPRVAPPPAPDHVAPVPAPSAIPPPVTSEPVVAMPAPPAPADAPAEAPAPADSAPADSAPADPAPADPAPAEATAPIPEPPAAPAVSAVPAPAPSQARDPPPAEAAPQPVARLDPAVVALLISRGNEMLARGDISAARLLYARAASAGSAAAATAMGRSFDAAVLDGLGVRGIRPDPEQAAHWYRRARELGTARP